jgi:hypothetical protein
MLGSDTFRPYAPPTSKLHISPGQLMIAAAVLSPFLLELLGGAGSTSPQKSVTSPPFVFDIAISVSVFAPALLTDSASRNTLYMQCEPSRTSLQFHCLSSPPQYLRNCVDCNPDPPSSILSAREVLDQAITRYKVFAKATSYLEAGCIAIDQSGQHQLPGIVEAVIPASSVSYITEFFQSEKEHLGGWWFWSCFLLHFLLR